MATFEADKTCSVDAGIYTGNGNGYGIIWPNADGITLRGTGTNATIISAEGLGRVIQIDQMTEAHIVNIENLTIRDGRVTTGNHGAGIGYPAWEAGHTLNLSGVNFIGNRTGGDGNSSGGAIFSSAVTVNASNCMFNQNYSVSWGGVFFINNDGIVNASNCIFTNNTAWGGGVIGWGGLMNATNCIFYNNYGSVEAAINDLTFINVKNSIFWNNTSRNNTVFMSNSNNITYSDVQGGFDGIGNLNKDPLFLNASGGDYHLSAFSFCVDSGTFEGAIDHDLDGVSRPQLADDPHANFDMGCYEREGKKFPIIKVIQPNGGQTIEVGTVYNIIWDISRIVTTDVFVRLSTNEGLTWDVLITREPGVLGISTYEWTPTESLISNKCLISIEAGGPDQWTSTMSNSAFRIKKSIWHAYVSWETGSDTNPGTAALPFKHIQKAFDVIEAGGSVEVDSGIYAENLIWPNLDNITLKRWHSTSVPTIDGGGINRCISVGQYAYNVDKNLTIEGITLQNGYTNEVFTHGGGGGIYLQSGDDLWLNDVTIKYCTSENKSGGAVYSETRWCNVFANNCVFSGNRSSGGGKSGGSGGVFWNGVWNCNDCVFSGNSANYGGVAYGGDDAVGTWPTSFFSDCLFSRNMASGADHYGGVAQQVSFETVNCSFINNSADYGGIAESVVWLAKNCDFVNNSAVVGGGVADASYSWKSINCIYWGNTGSSGEVFSDFSPNLEYCDLQPDGWTVGDPYGTGGTITSKECISSDPLFISTNEASLNFLRLGSGSLCIDAGTFESGIPAKDAAGNSRPYGARADIGAYEFQGLSILPGIWVSTGGLDTNDGKNVTPVLTIAKALSLAGPGETVNVFGGTYSGPGNYNIRWPNKNNVTLRASMETTPVTIDALGMGRCITLEAVATLVTNMTLEGITLQGGKVINANGGGIYLNKANTTLYLNDVTIQNCSAEGTGNSGAIYAINNTTVNIFARNCIFNKNTAAYGGGVAYYGIWTATSCAFTANRATDTLGYGYGGVFYGTYIKAFNSIFVSNNAAGQGGAVYSSTLYANSCTFEGNTATNEGGVISVGTVYAANSTFNNNQSTNKVGGVSNACTWIATGCAFSNNYAKTEGGVSGGGTWTASSCAFINNTAGNAGGVLGWGGLLTWKVTNCTFKNNRAVNVGGVSWYRSTWYVTNCTFEGNSAKNGGVVVRENIWYVSNSTFNNNTAESGGVTYFDTTAVTMIATNCSFSGNRAVNGNGGVAYGLTMTASSCSFVSNEASGQGGVNYGGTSWAVNRCTFEANTALGYGGVNAGSTWYATNSTFNNNSAPNGGVTYYGNWTATACAYSNNHANNGGMFNTDTAQASQTFTLKTNNCIFDNNYAADKGGLVYSAGGTTGFGPTVIWNASSCTFSNNRALIGGLAYNYGNWTYNTLNALNCTFESNKATNEGGILYNYTIPSSNDNTWTTTNCAFNNNSAGNGGVAYNYPSKSLIWNANNCTFLNNLASTDAGVAYNSTWTVSNCAFEGNKAGRYGGVNRLGKWNIKDSTFTNNCAGYNTTSGNGGVFSDVTTANTSTATNCAFIGNWAYTSGGVGYLSSLKAFNCSFTSNEAKNDMSAAGGVGFWTTMEAFNCVFNSNKAVFAGGVGRYGKWTLKNCTLYKNSTNTGGSGGAYNNADLNAINSILWNNSATTGPLFNGMIAGSTLKYSDVQQNGWGVLTQTNCISLEPGFVSTAEGSENFYLLISSPCIDIGTFEGPAYDKNNYNRPLPAGGIKDIGAYEFGGEQNPPEPFVDQTGKAYYNLNLAVNNAKAGDVINIPAGVMTNMVINWPNVDNITLSGEGMGVTTMEGEGLMINIPPGVHATIEGISFHGTGTNPSTIMVSNSTAIIGGCELVNVNVTAHSDLTLINCLITGASSLENGGGVYGDSDCNLKVINCTIYGNTAGTGYHGGGIYIEAGGTLEVVNSIVWGNVPDQISGEGNITVKYSNIQDGWPGTGNISSEPLFIDPGAIIFRVLPTSECIDSGTSEGAPSIDITGKHRPQGAGYDMGCYEQLNSETGPIKINGAILGDIIPASFMLTLPIKDTDGIASVEVDIYSTPQHYILNLTSGTTFDGVWSMPMELHLNPGTHTFLFTVRDGSNTITNVIRTAQVMRGSVKVVGTPLNYPNPFRPGSGGTTRIQYFLSSDAPVSVIIYDITGHEVKRFNFASGTEGGRADVNNVIWNGRNMFNKVSGNGMYMYKVISRDEVIGTGKLVILDQ